MTQLGIGIRAVGVDCCKLFGIVLWADGGNCRMTLFGIGKRTAGVD
jgi:hypothetical protein